MSALLTIISEMMAVALFVPNEMRRKEARDFVYTAMDVLRGILVSNFIDPDSDRALRRWRRASAHLRAVAAAALGAVGPVESAR